MSSTRWFSRRLQVHVGLCGERELLETGLLEVSDYTTESTSMIQGMSFVHNTCKVEAYSNVEAD